MVGIIVFDTLFMLIFFVAKIAGFSLAVSKHTKDSGLWLFRTSLQFHRRRQDNLYVPIRAFYL